MEINEEEAEVEDYNINLVESKYHNDKEMNFYGNKVCSSVILTLL